MVLRKDKVAHCLDKLHRFWPHHDACSTEFRFSCTSCVICNSRSGQSTNVTEERVLNSYWITYRKSTNHDQTKINNKVAECTKHCRWSVRLLCPCHVVRPRYCAGQ